MNRVNPDQILLADCVKNQRRNVPATDSHVGAHIPPMIISAEEGKVVLQFDLEQKFAQPNGGIQGGIACVALDTGLAFCGLTLVEQGQSVISLNLDTRFLRPIPVGKALVYADVDAGGKSIIFCSATLKSGNETLAKASSTLKVINAR